SPQRRLRSHPRRAAPRGRRGAAHVGSPPRDGRADTPARAAHRRHARDADGGRSRRARPERRAHRARGAQARARRRCDRARCRGGARGRSRPTSRALLGDGAAPEVERRATRRADRPRARPLSVIGRRCRSLPAFGALALALAGVTATAVAAASAPAACPGCVIAGAGRAPLTVPDGTPLAGYGGFARRLIVPDVLDRYPHTFWFKPGKRDGESLAARALVLERDGTRVVWVAVDMIAVDRAFTETVASRLLRAGARPGVLILSASHTHSGPGAFVDSALMGFL